MVHKETQTANIEPTEILQMRKDFTDLQREYNSQRTFRNAGNHDRQTPVTQNRQKHPQTTAEEKKRNKEKRKELYTITTMTTDSKEAAVCNHRGTTNPELAPDETNNQETTRAEDILALATIKMKTTNVSKTATKDQQCFNKYFFFT